MMKRKGQGFTIGLLIAAVLGLIAIVILWPAIKRAVVGMPQPAAREFAEKKCVDLCGEWNDALCPLENWNQWLTEDCKGRVVYMNRTFWCGSDPGDIWDPANHKCGPREDYDEIIYYTCPCRAL